MDAYCSYCNVKFEIDTYSFLVLFKTQRKVYCVHCRNKRTMGCYQCKDFTRFYDYDYCSAFRSEFHRELPIYCDQYKPKEKQIIYHCNKSWDDDNREECSYITPEGCSYQGECSYKAIQSENKKIRWCSCGDEILIPGDKCEVCKFIEEQKESES